MLKHKEGVVRPISTATHRDHLRTASFRISIDDRLEYLVVAVFKRNLVGLRVRIP